SPCGLSNIMVDIAVKSGAAWVCHAEGHHLADVLLPVHINDEDDHEDELDVCSLTCVPVLLEQTEEGSPCVLTVHCSPTSPAAISRLLVISEARTMELYDQMGEYCGTVRGERDDSIQPDSEDRGPFYRKRLVLEHPSSACEVKLLSLAGRSSVLVSQVIVGLKPLQPCPVRGPGIDMQQVQCLVEEMGTSLSPGAQNLMDMVHFQQKNQTSSLGGFLPLLMGGGALSFLAQGANISPAAVDNQTPSAESAVSVLSVDSIGHAQLAEMMSHFLKGQGHGQALSPGPELLPMLQSVCGQVTQLRLDDAAAAAEKEKTMRNGTWELDSAMEQRLEEMERRLKEHVDRRLDALEQKLEKALLSALPMVALNQGLTAPGPPQTRP
uniref:Si:rp71-19m20.1 n=1 Tax=Seriola dumerili TaxID=41447 RepID=A0A3B4TH11_SERDU